MRNTVRMDFYRMFKSKAMYMTWLFLTLSVLVTSYLVKVQYIDHAPDKSTASDNLNTKADVSNSDTEMNISVDLKGTQDKGITLDDMVFTEIESKLLAVFICIFSVIFTLADFRNGYIKNVGGQVKKRWYLILSKVVCFLVYTILTTLLLILVQAVICKVMFGYCTLWSLSAFSQFILAEIFLHFVLSLLCMTFVILTRSLVFGMIFAGCLSLNVLTIAYGILDKALSHGASSSLHPFNYTITSQISLLPFQISPKDVGTALLISLVYFILTFAFSCICFSKRDVC